ncbi:type II secretion system F family protein [Paenibacillus sp. GCM10012307]|uniref:Type II secretion system F family protein n=1 Tax=Paenibacillus roseus TaxID=2798579 RepID=A0A934J1E4_9BACL|nr:type II secretion system F family protein [Paenibacillus roseus]MBJ6361529.1 type II secretion system F family protein [Paenibacillus roseus]
MGIGFILVIHGTLLFFLLCGVLYLLFNAMAELESRQDRLNYKRNGRLISRFARWLSRYEAPHRHLSDLLESMRWPLQAGGFVLLCVLLFVAGMVSGIILFHSAKGAVLLAMLLGATPYLWLRMSLVQRQLKTQLDFLPAVELFYQCYLITGERQIRSALQRTVEEERLLGPIQGVFEQLYRNLSVRGDDESSLRIFSASLGHVWADYYTQILRVALAEGHPVGDNLKELITDMRKARRANQQERNRLLEIRIANFTPILFLALFIGINLHYNPDQAYYYYVLDPQGRDMLLNAAALIFISFVMGLYLSRKKM